MNWWERIADIEWSQLWVAFGNMALMLLLGLFVVGVGVAMILSIFKMFNGKKAGKSWPWLKGGKS